jgi:hypothetical protein
LCDKPIFVFAGATTRTSVSGQFGKEGIQKNALF